MRLSPRAVVLDFDGVVIESVAIKGAAFRALFAAYPQHLDAIERFHYDNAGMSRHRKFAWIYDHLLCQPLSSEQSQALGERFGTLVADAMRTCAFVPGAREFIEAHQHHEPLFVASGTPEEELKAIINDRGLALSFRAVYGAPRRKSDLLRLIADDMRTDPDTLLFVGDAREDWAAATEVGVPFVARVPSGGDPAFAPGAVAIVRDLRDLERLWNR